MSHIFFYRAEAGIRCIGVTGVQTCALPTSFGQKLALLNLARRRLSKASFCPKASCNSRAKFFLDRKSVEKGKSGNLGGHCRLRDKRGQSRSDPGKLDIATPRRWRKPTEERS